MITTATLTAFQLYRACRDDYSQLIGVLLCGFLDGTLTRRVNGYSFTAARFSVWKPCKPRVVVEIRRYRKRRWILMSAWRSRWRRVWALTDAGKLRGKGWFELALTEGHPFGEVEIVQDGCELRIVEIEHKR